MFNTEKSMYIKSLKLQNFRNYAEESFAFDPAVNLICGENGQGKTNLLEAAAACSTMRLFRTAQKKEGLRFGEDAAFICSEFEAQGRENTLELRLSRLRAMEIYKNGVRQKRQSDVQGLLKTVLFCPEDLMLVRAGAAARRRFLDTALCQLRPNYARYLEEYNRLHEHKTRILRDSEEKPSLLSMWEDFSLRMARIGAQIIRYRAYYCRRLLAAAAAVYSDIAPHEALSGVYRTVSSVSDPFASAQQLERELTEKMNEAAEELQFERAADLRDRLRAIQKLGTRQHVVAGAFAELDAIAFVQGQTRACVCVLHYGGGSLQSKEYTLFHLTGGDPAEVLSAFVKQYYAQRGAAPKTVLLSHEIEDADAAGEYLSSLAGRKAELAVPQRGERRVLTRLAEKNAYEEIERREKQSERRHKSLELLQSVTGMAALPLRLEAYDISNFAGQDTVGSMIVFVEGQPKKSDYRKFRIACAANGQDDYASMREMLTRRVQRYADGDEKFAPLPNAFMIDGGLGHVRICKEVLDSFGLSVPCFGMVKDDHHRTRALIAPDGREFGISATPALFALVGRMQEEVHRFAIEYNRKRGGKRVRGSTLDRIPGVGDKRRTELLRHFGSVENIRHAEENELARIVPRNTAKEIYDFFHKEG
mgnify:CR=1 FL=1